MITTKPAIQAGICHVYRHSCIKTTTLRDVKRHANRRHRRALNMIVQAIQHDEELWWDECFTAPTLSDWDLW